MERPTSRGGNIDEGVVAALRAGDEAAFVAFAVAHQAYLLRVARMWTKDASLAEEVVQEAWLAMLRGIDSFEGRSSLKTWLCGTVINIARARLRKEGRSVPMSSLPADPSEAAVDPCRFATDFPWEGHWETPPTAVFPANPEGDALRVELRAQLESAVSELPEMQRSVLVLRDVEGLSAEEVCNVLCLSDTNQRVLLHRARSRVRAMLEQHFDGGRR